MKLIKLTKADGRSTYGNVRWATGTTVFILKAECRKKLCEKGLLHVYVGETIEHALALGLMMDPAHARIGIGVRAFEVTGKIEVHDPTKAGGWCLKVGDEIRVVLPTREQRVRFAIYCARAVLTHDVYPVWWKWAERWLDGERSEDSAWAAVWEAAEACARSVRASKAAVWAAAGAAQSAARAAAGPTWAATEATALAAVKAGWAAPDLDLAGLALRAIREEAQS